MLLNVQLNVVQVELSQSLQLDAKGPNGVLAYRTKSVCKNPYNTRYLLVL